MKEDAVVQIAQKNGVEPGTILLSYLVNRDIVGKSHVSYVSCDKTDPHHSLVLPKSVNPKRIASNLNIIDLSKEDIEALNHLADGDKQKRFCNPPWVSC